VIAGITFDTGALIALERKRSRMLKVLYLTTALRKRITVPTVVLAEWWRVGGRRHDDILAGVTVEPLDERLAKNAGDAMAAVRGASTIDAIVMASAALRGDIVYTSDVDDLMMFHAHFPEVDVSHV
jgi:predicted nucleic acid-binding protein